MRDSSSASRPAMGWESCVVGLAPRASPGGVAETWLTGTPAPPPAWLWRGTGTDTVCCCQVGRAWQGETPEGPSCRGAPWYWVPEPGSMAGGGTGAPLGGGPGAPPTEGGPGDPPFVSPGPGEEAPGGGDCCAASGVERKATSVTATTTARDPDLFMAQAPLVSGQVPTGRPGQ